MVENRSLDLVRRIVGTAILGIIIASIFGVAPAPLTAILGRSIIANAAPAVYAENVSSVTTSRDGPPFNGNIFVNETLLITVELINPIPDATINIGARVVKFFPDGSFTVRYICTIPATPNFQAALKKTYSVTIFTNITLPNPGWTNLFYLTDDGYNSTTGAKKWPTSPTDWENKFQPLNTCVSVDPDSPMGSSNQIRVDLGDVIQLYFNDANGNPVVFRSLTAANTPPSSVTGIPALISPANIDQVPLAGTFGFTAPDLNKFWNLNDSSKIYIVFGNDSLGYFLTNRLFVNETGIGGNTSVFQNALISTLGQLLNTSAIPSQFFATNNILNQGNYTISLLVPRSNSTPLPKDLDGSIGAKITFNNTITDYPTFNGWNFFVINVSISVGAVPPVELKVDRTFLPATVDYNLSINVTIIDPSATTGSIVFGQNLNATFYNYLGQPVKTNVPLTTLFSATSVKQIAVSPPTFSLFITINGPLAFQYPYEVQNGSLVITYRSPTGLTVSTPPIPIITVDVSLTVNGSQSIQVNYGAVVNITMINPAADTNRSAFDTVVVTVLGATVPSSGVITLNETAPGSGVFTALLRVGDDANISANPEAVIAFRYVNRASPETPFGSTVWYSKTVEANVKILSTFGSIVSPPDGYRTGPMGMINVTIVDHDKNRNVNSNDTISYNIKLWDGRVITRTATETRPNSGVFTDVFDKSLLGTPADLLRGQVIQIVYSDVDTPAGPTSVVATVTFFSVDGRVTLDRPFYLPGQNITITVTDPDAVINPAIVETIIVRVTSTSDPLGIQVVLTETAPGTGVFVGSVLVSNNSADRGKERIIYANIGDTITVTYTDQFPADFAQTGRSKDIPERAFVGQLLERPISFPPTITMTYTDGTPVTQPAAGRTVLFTVNATNNNPVPVTATILFQVFDANGVPLTLQAVTVTIPAGQTFGITFSFIFPSPGTYTVRVSAVKSLTDLTPLADKREFTVTVVGGTVAPSVATQAVVQQDYRVKMLPEIIAVRN